MTNEVTVPLLPCASIDGGFSVIDPGGNWIRVVQNAATAPTPAAAPTGRLAKALANAVVQGDSKGDVRQAVRILDSALARVVLSADETERAAPTFETIADLAAALR